MKAVAWKSLIAPATDFFTDTEVENFNSSSPYSAFLWDLRNYCSTFYADPGVVHAGAKLDTRGHRSATDFALGPFLHMQILIDREGQETLALQEHSSSQASLAEALPWWLES